MTSKVVRGLLLALPLLVYLALPTRNYYWDGVDFAVNIEKHSRLALLLHPNHLIYAWFGSWLYALGLKTRALFLLQRVNSILAGGCVFLIYRILRKFQATPEWSVAGALLLAFSATWWRFSTDADAYIPSIFLLLCAFLLLDRQVILAGLFTAAAMVFHELAIFFLPVACFKLSKNRAIYLVTSIVPVIAAYLWACRVEFGEVTISHLLKWVSYHSPDSNFSFQPFRDLVFTLRGTLRLFFGGKPDAFAGDLFSKLALTATVIAIAIFAATMWRAKGAAAFTKPPTVLLVWIAVYVGFLFLWMPQNTFYRLFYLPPLIAAGILWMGGAPRIRVVAAFIMAMFLWNLTFEIYPQSRVEANVPLEFAIEHHDAWPPGTPVVFHHFHTDLWTISYFNPQVSWIGLERPDIANLNEDLDYAHRVDKPLWLEADTYNMIASTADGRAWIAEHGRPSENIEFKDAKHDFRFYCAR